MKEFENFSEKNILEIGNDHLEKGDFSKARQQFLLANKLAKKRNNPHIQTLALVKLGDLSNFQRRFIHALNFWKQASTINLRSNTFTGEICAKLGLLYLNLGVYEAARVSLERAANRFREKKLLSELCEVLAFLGLLYHQIDDDETALDYTQIALQTTQEINARPTHITALIFQGHILTRLNRIDRAFGSYDYALNLQSEMTDPRHSFDAQAGRVRAYLAMGDQNSAYQISTSAASQLLNADFEGVIEPVRSMLAFYNGHIFFDVNQSKEILTVSYKWLISRANEINHTWLWRSYLENIAAHRILLRIWLEKEF